MTIREIRNSIKDGVYFRERVPSTGNIVESKAISEPDNKGIFIACDDPVPPEYYPQPTCEISIYDITAIKINDQWVEVI